MNRWGAPRAATHKPNVLRPSRRAGIQPKQRGFLVAAVRASWPAHLVHVWMNYYDICWKLQSERSIPDIVYCHVLVVSYPFDWRYDKRNKSVYHVICDSSKRLFQQPFPSFLPMDLLLA